MAAHPTVNDCYEVLEEEFLYNIEREKIAEVHACSQATVSYIVSLKSKNSRIAAVNLIKEISLYREDAEKFQEIKRLLQ